MENIIAEGTKIKLGEKEYTMRRLNTRDVFKVAAILGKVYKPGFKVEEDGSFAELLLGAIPVAEDAIIEFLAGLMQLSVKEFDTLPPDAIFDIAEVLSDSEDLKRFFDKAKKLMAKLPTPKEAQAK